MLNCRSAAAFSFPGQKRPLEAPHHNNAGHPANKVNAVQVVALPAVQSRDSHRRKDELKKKQKAYASDKPRTTGLSLSQVVRMAAERHVSYGEMVLIIEKGDVKA